MAERGELRDYFDLMAIEQQAGRTVEEGLGLYLARYWRRRQPELIANLARTGRA